MSVIPVVDHGTIYLLAMAFAASETFQEVTGTNTQSGAFERIHYPTVSFQPAEEEGDPPIMMVDLLPPRIVISDELGDEELNDGGLHSFTMQETFWASFDFYAPEEVAQVSDRNAWAWFRKKVLAILKEARALGKTAPVGGVGGTGRTYPVLRSIRRTEGPYELDVVEQEKTEELDDPAECVPQRLWHVAYEITRGN